MSAFIARRAAKRATRLTTHVLALYPLVTVTHRALNRQVLKAIWGEGARG
jgi:hypothetical protein